MSELIVNDLNFRNAVISDIELTNGKETKMITIFNSNEVNFEEVVIGINTAINRQSQFYKNIHSVKNTFCGFENGKIKPFAKYYKKELKHAKNGSNI